MHVSPSSTRRFAGAAVAVAAVLMAAGTAGAAPGAVTVGELAGLQPAPSAVDDIIAGPGMRKPGLTVSYHSTALQITTSTAAQCAGAVHLADEAVYSPSDYQGIDMQVLTSVTTGPVRGRVTSTVAAFPDDTAALSFVAQTGQQWQGCDGQPVNISYADEPDESWYVQQVTPQGDGYVVRSNRVSDHSACSHVISAKANVVLEAMVCTSGIVTDQAVRVADLISSGITA